MIDNHLLRTATPEDTAFQAALYASTRQQELEAAQLPPEVIGPFLDMQFKAQTQHYTTHHPDAEWLIIECAGERAGRLILDRAADHLNIMDIALLPTFRGHGIGTHLIRQVLAEAETKRLPVRLFAYTGERAIQLYHRLGFQNVKEDPVHTELVWRPS